MKKLPLTYTLFVGLAAFLLSAFNQISVDNNQLTDAEKKEGWKLLFDGKTLNGWHLYNKGKIASAWTVRDGDLYCDPEAYKPERGDLVSDGIFTNYELKFDWKIAQGGNSGVFINVAEQKDLPTAWTSGPEYQLLERSHPDFDMSPQKRAGALFNLYPPKNAVDPKPFDQWNQSVIKQVNGTIEFYLNGVLTAQQDLTSQAWKDKIAQSNFKAFPQFGTFTKGRIALQDWSKGIAFRNIKVKPL